MSTTPASPRPPVAPGPPHAQSQIVLIALFILAVIVLVSGIAVWTGLRFLSRAVRVHVEDGAAGKNQVTIKTPVGSFGVAKEASEANLGLPIYPGAKRIKDDSATLRFDLPDDQNVRIVLGKFETSDSIGRVKQFYQKSLGRETTRFVAKDPQGRTVFEIKRDHQEKFVALTRVGSGTRIELVRVVRGGAEAN